MDFVYGDGALVPSGGFSMVEPLAITPSEAVSADDQRCVLCSVLGKKCEGIRFQKGLTGAGLDLELVVGFFGDLRDEDFPNPAIPEDAHDMPSTVPVIEVADDADALCIGGPDGECGSLDAVHLAELRSEMVVELPKLAFAEEVRVELAEHAAEAVGVFFCEDCATFEGVFESVVFGESVGAFCFEDAGALDAAHREWGSRFAFERDDAS